MNVIPSFLFDFFEKRRKLFSPISKFNVYSIEIGMEGNRSGSPAGFSLYRLGIVFKWMIVKDNESMWPQIFQMEMKDTNWNRLWHFSNQWANAKTLQLVWLHNNNPEFNRHVVLFFLFFEIRHIFWMNSLSLIVS